MPHCIIEHSPALSAHSLNQSVFTGALASSLFDSEGRDIKVRSLAYDHYQTGKQVQDFVHVQLRILSGRSAEQKAKLSQAVMDELSSLHLQHTSITVEVIDMDRASYQKRLA